MKLFFIALLQLVLSASFLEAQGIGDVSNARQPIVLKGRKKLTVLRQKEWARGYAKGAENRQTGRGYQDTDPVAVKKGIPTSEAFQSGYRVGYTQKRP